MARNVLFTEKRPKILTPDNNPIALCMCGISKNKPFCDGSHHITSEEEDNKIYIYDENNNRKEVNNGN